MNIIAVKNRSTVRLADTHSHWVSFGLHLMPGILTGVVYYLLANPVAELGYPSIVALMVAGLLVLMPFELGMIVWAARNSGTGSHSFIDMIGYRQQLPFWRYLVWVPVLFLVTGLIFTVLKPVGQSLQSAFSWLPASMVINMGLSGGFARSTLIWVTIFNGLLVGVVFPIVEELYFRGFLLPRMPGSMKGWTPLIHSFLFAAYHVWTPWMLVTRTLGLLPFIYLVRRERNLYVGMIVHCIVNLLDVVTMVAFLNQ